LCAVSAGCLVALVASSAYYTLRPKDPLAAGPASNSKPTRNRIGASECSPLSPHGGRRRRWRPRPRTCRRRPGTAPAWCGSARSGARWSAAAGRGGLGRLTIGGVPRCARSLYRSRARRCSVPWWRKMARAGCARSRSRPSTPTTFVFNMESLGHGVGGSGGRTPGVTSG
jgi:hypothetical protein